MRFGIFDHLDDSGQPLKQHFEERLQRIEAYDRASFYGYHLARIIHEEHRLARMSAETLAFCRVTGTNPVGVD